jgi:hypothetical protein
VRTTVRSLQRERDVQAMLNQGAKLDQGAMLNQGRAPADRLSFFAANLEADQGWPEAVAGCE